MSKAIRMAPKRLPELTREQQDRVTRIRYWCRLHNAKVSVTRKGQRRGHICVTVESEGGRSRVWYDPAANLVNRTFEPRL